MTLALFPHQHTGAEFLANRHAALLADGCRCGKSASTLEGARRVNPRAPILVAGPAIARGVWATEAATWRPDLKVVRIESKRTFRFPKPGEMVITSYQLLPALFNDEDIAKGTILVVEECHIVSKLEAARTQRTEAICFAVRRRGGRVWALSATPMMNRPEELWTVLGLLSSQALCFNDRSQFLKCYNAIPLSRTTTRWGLPTADVPARLSRIMLRRTLAEVSSGMPDNTVQVIPVPISQDARGLCDRALAAIRKRGMALSQAAEMTAKFGSPTWQTMSRAKVALAISKLPYTVQMVEKYEAAGEPLIVMSASRGVTDALAARKGWACITGDTSTRRREDVQKELRDGKLLGVACSIASAGVAIDLSTAAVVLFNDLPWEPGSVEQAAERIRGPKQTRPTSTLYLRADHAMDNLLWETNALKNATIGRTMQRA